MLNFCISNGPILIGFSYVLLANIQVKKNFVIEFACVFLFKVFNVQAIHP
jgi:hypothetical protein